MSSAAASAPRLAASDVDWSIRVFYDGECPLCRREIDVLRRLDAGRGRADFVDLAAPSFVAADFGVTQDEIEARIHGQLPDGEIIEGVDVFVHLYEAVGIGWLAAPARWPGFRWLLDRAYLWFARHRLRLTGRSPRTCPAPSRELSSPR